MTPTASELPPDHIYCNSCWKIIRKIDKYCPHCGSYQNFQYEIAQESRTIEGWKSVKGIIAFYIIYLTTILPLFWIKNESAVTAMLVVSIIDAVIILIFLAAQKISLRPYLTFDRTTLKYTLLAFVLLFLLLGINISYHRFIGDLFKITAENESAWFRQSGYGFGYIIFLVCVMPGFWEELAFRGIIQTQFIRAIRENEAIFLSAALFAIIHVAIFSWPYLFLMGVVLGHLRKRSHSLWPGIVLHFLHNFGVTLLEYAGG